MPEQAVNFENLLSKKVKDAERPKPLPTGDYIVQFTRNELGTSSKKGTPFVSFFYKILEAKEDVDKKALKNIKNVDKKEFHYEFYITENSEFMLRDFFVEVLKMRGAEDRSFAECIPEVKGKKAKATYIHEMTTNDNIRAQVDSWSPAS